MSQSSRSALSPVQILTDYANKAKRRIVALHSGTSTDGVSAAVIEMEGSGHTARAELIQHNNFDYSQPTREKLFELYDHSTATIHKVCQANFLLGRLFAQAAERVADQAGLRLADIDLVASSGQIVYHVRAKQNQTDIWIEDREIPSAMDLGEGTVIAQHTGVTTITNMRSRDMAAGGQGNPLVAYGDWVLFRHPQRTRIIQNIGGIANPTVLPAGGDIESVNAFDTGPGNMVIDHLIETLTQGNQVFDEDGQLAAKGQVHKRLLNDLLQHEFIRRTPPKATGQEVFGKRFSQVVLEKGKALGLSDADLIATATALTVESIALNYECFIYPRTKADEVLLCGGGAHNRTLVRMLSDRLSPIRVSTVQDAGIPVGAREVVCVGVIANETMQGQPGNVPTSTGAAARVIMGEFAFPNPASEAISKLSVERNADGC